MSNQPLTVAGRVKFKKFDPAYSAGLDKAETKAATEGFRHRIDELQQLLYANSSHALLLVFQGMDASGKDGSVRSVLRHVNPAGVQVANFKVPSSEESAHDYLWRVHREVPRYGNIGVFNRSHYEAVLVERILGLVGRKEWKRRYAQIVAWERMLTENRVLLLKFYLHVSREEQAERFRERLADPAKYWKFSRADLTTRQRWADYVDAYEDMLSATSMPEARWHVVPADRNWYRDYVVARTVVEALEGLRLKWPKAKEDLSKIRIK
ncbi:MAG: Polyphosphate:nucleotide phosphotransferase, family [Verrucomicrobia bacterium]|nr:Polyphosphate:nucleotide phosphotransferase, family [Verrucomicrobiota bacterium]